MTVMGGQYSLPFTAAVALTRDMSNPLVYNDEAVRDPLVRRLAQDMELEIDQSHHDGHGVVPPAEVTIVCAGKTFAKTTTPHKGSPANPLGWDDACEKFTRYTRSFIDAAQAREIIAAVKEQLDTLPFSPRRFTNPAAVELAERLAALAPDPLGKVLLAPGGTLAIGMALKLARVATGRHKTISMWDSFHGASLDAISIGGEALFRRGIGPLLPGTEHVPPCDPQGCRFGCAGRCDARCAEYVDYVLGKEEDVAAVVVETIRCTDVQIPPPSYYRILREATSELLCEGETRLACVGETLAEVVNYPLAGLFVLFLASSLPLAFWLDAATYLASAALLATMIVPPVIRRLRTDATAGAGADGEGASDAEAEAGLDDELEPIPTPTSVVADMREGWSFLRHETVLLANTFQGAAGQFAIGFLTRNRKTCSGPARTPWTTSLESTCG